jgi:hypothetical protein
MDTETTCSKPASRRIVFLLVVVSLISVGIELLQNTANWKRSHFGALSPSVSSGDQQFNHTSTSAINCTRLLLRQAHSHNDYEQENPLYSALKHGIRSVEADVFVRNDKLWVAHKAQELNPKRTIETLYIQPLVELMKVGAATGQEASLHTKLLSNQDQLLNLTAADAIILLVDIKEDPIESIRLLKVALTPLLPHLSKIDSIGQFAQGQITVVLSGNLPKQFEVLEDANKEEGERFLFLDGRESDLIDNSDTRVVPMVSFSWTHFPLVDRVLGREESSLRELAAMAHQQGKLLRIWGAPNRDSTWDSMLKGNVDILSVDNHERYLRYAKGKHRHIGC